MYIHKLCLVPQFHQKLSGKELGHTCKHFHMCQLGQYIRKLTLNHMVMQLATVGDGVTEYVDSLCQGVTSLSSLPLFPIHLQVCQQFIVRGWGQGLDQRTKKDQKKIEALLNLCWQSWTSLSSDYSGRNSSASANTLSDPSFEAYGKSSSHFQMVLSMISSLHKLGIKYLVMDSPHTRFFAR